MNRHIAAKVIELIVTLVTITFLSFMLVYLAPSDAAEKMLNGNGFIASQETIDAMRSRLGLDQDVFTQYISWISGVIQGNLGTSFRTGRPVVSQLAPALLRTLELAALAFSITVAVSIPTGIQCAKRKNGTFDRIIRYCTYFFASLPSFFLGIVVLYVLAGRLGVIPASMATSSNPLTLFVPACVLAFSLSAWMIRQVRTAVLEKLDDGFVTGLRMRGIPEHVIFRSYVLKASMAPIITALGICLGSLMGGAVLVENVFSWPGLGQVVLTAINYLDYPVIQGFAIWIALIYFAINILIDVFCALADPRIRMGGGVGGSSSNMVEK
ncbi:MAG: ABC transporter permease [Coriobacteriales bacterium]